MPITQLTIDCSKLPGIIKYLRNEMALLLEDQADEEVSSYVATRLREIASIFKDNV